jgi:hypothetical protein
LQVAATTVKRQMLFTHKTVENIAFAKLKRNDEIPLSRLQYGAHAESRKGLDETSSHNKTRTECITYRKEKVYS